MEIRQFTDFITGVVATADVVEGRLGKLTSHTFDGGYGYKTDLPGFKVPATAEEAKEARFVITWAVDSREYPMWTPIPSFSWSNRQGWDKDAQSPFSATMYVTNPGNQNDVTIPSGTDALAFGTGVYTFTASDYIADNGLKVPGALVQVANTAEDGADAGKIKVLASSSDRKIGRVREFDTTTNKLTIELD